MRRIREWPANGPEQRAELDALAESRTHVIRPLPVYGVDGCLMDPSEYETHLRGSIVEVRFKLQYRHIDAFTGEFRTTIVNMEVRQPPPAVLSTMKRRPDREVTTESYARTPQKRVRLQSPGEQFEPRIATHLPTQPFDHRYALHPLMEHTPNLQPDI